MLDSYLKELFMRLLSVDSESFHERMIADLVASELRDIGFVAHFDLVPAPNGEKTVNLRANLPSGEKTLLFVAHLDTVESTSGLIPKIEGNIIRSSGNTILGADDKAGIAALIAGVRNAKEKGTLNVSVEALFTAAEERGLSGARYVNPEHFKGRVGFVLDGEGPVGTLVMSAPYHEKIEAHFTGKAAHAGIDAKKGKSAVLAMSKAIALSPQGQLDEFTTSNIGIANGGSAMNIIPEKAFFVAETRSQEEKKLLETVEVFRNACEKSSRETGVKVDFKTERLYDGYVFFDNQKVVKLAKKVLKEIRVDVLYKKTMGGSDANILNAKGFQVLAVGIGCGNSHTKEEWADLEQLNKLSLFVETALKIANEVL